MSKVIIESTNDNKVIVTFDNGHMIYPICEVTEGNFKISEVTDINILTLISNLIHQVGTSLRFKLNKQGFVNKPLNKPTGGK